LSDFWNITTSYISIYEKRRVGMIENTIQISLNKKRKEKVNYQFFPKFSSIYLNLFEFYRIFEESIRIN